MRDAAWLGLRDVTRHRQQDRGAMRIWFKEIKGTHLIRDLVITDDSEDTRTHKVFRALDEACYELGLARPIWLEPVIKDFKRHARTRFTQDAFVEELDFDYLEMQVLEED